MTTQPVPADVARVEATAPATTRLVATPPAASPVADQLVQLARQITDRQEFQVGSAFAAALRLVVSLGPGIRWATVTTRRSSRATPGTAASTDAIATALDRLQCCAGQGPLLEALATGTAVLTGDLRHERRWPHFTAEAVRTSPARTVVSFPLAPAGHPRTTLNLYGDDPATLEQQPEDVLAVAAGTAVVMAAIAVRERADHLAQAMVSNREIGTAIGILMNQHTWTQDQAFAALRRRSQREHCKLRQVAAEIVRTGSLPGPEAAD